MSNEFGAFKRAEEYKPAPEFEEDDRELLADISLSDSTELWLIQWPANQVRSYKLILENIIATCNLGENIIKNSP